MSQYNMDNGPDVLGERFIHWCLCFTFSVVTLGSAIEAVAEEEDDSTLVSQQRWATFGSGVQLLFSLGIIIAHLYPGPAEKVVGTKVEGFITVVYMALGAVIVYVVSNSSDGLAVVNGAVRAGNLYYFSWAGLVTSIMVFVAYLRSSYQIDVAGAIKDRSPRLTQWAAFLVSSLVVMACGADIFNDFCDDGAKGQKFCNRTTFAVVLGTFGTLLALIIVAYKVGRGDAPFILEVIFSALMCVSYAFGVAFITSEEGPGSPLGNLYYFSWISFLLTFFLGSSCYEEYQTGPATNPAENFQPDDQRGPDPEFEITDGNVGEG